MGPGPRLGIQLGLTSLGYKLGLPWSSPPIPRFAEALKAWKFPVSALWEAAVALTPGAGVKAKAKAKQYMALGQRESVIF